MRVTSLVSLCHPSDQVHHRVLLDLVVQVHPFLQVGQLLDRLFDQIDRARQVRQADHLVQAIHGCPVIQTEHQRSYSELRSENQNSHIHKDRIFLANKNRNRNRNSKFI